MEKNWISLASIPPRGATLKLTDQSAWLELFKKFELECRAEEELVAELFVLQEESGVLLKGSVQGKLRFSCGRCTADCHYDIRERFESFELYPEDDKQHVFTDEHESYIETDEAVIRPALKGNGFDINPVAYVWQGISLALPLKPVCSEKCKGLCPVCGANKNKENCDCIVEQGDPRLAKLRGLVIK